MLQLHQTETQRVFISAPIIFVTVRLPHRQIHNKPDHLPSLVVEAGLEQVRPFCCWYSTIILITLVSYVHKYAFSFKNFS